MNSAFSPTTQDHVQLNRGREMQFVKQYLKTFGLTVAYGGVQKLTAIRVGFSRFVPSTPAVMYMLDSTVRRGKGQP